MNIYNAFNELASLSDWGDVVKPGEGDGEWEITRHIMQCQQSFFFS